MLPQTASLPMFWVGLAGQVVSVGQNLLVHLAVHLELQEHLEDPGACRHQACSGEVGPCFYGP